MNASPPNKSVPAVNNFPFGDISKELNVFFSSPVHVVSVKYLNWQQIPFINDNIYVLPTKVLTVVCVLKSHILIKPSLEHVYIKFLLS